MLGGANGVVFKLKLPKISAYIYEEGFLLDDCNMFKLMMTWVTCLSRMLVSVCYRYIDTQLNGSLMCRFPTLLHSRDEYGVALVGG